MWKRVALDQPRYALSHEILTYLEKKFRRFNLDAHIPAFIVSSNCHHRFPLLFRCATSLLCVFPSANIYYASLVLIGSASRQNFVALEKFGTLTKSNILVRYILLNVTWLRVRVSRYEVIHRKYYFNILSLRQCKRLIPRWIPSRGQ